MKNPYDGGFKILAEDHPELLLRLLGIVAPGEKPKIISVLRELQLDPVQIDHAYHLDGAAVVHFEAITSWDAKRTGRLALYHFLLRQKYGVPVTSHVVLMAEKYAPKNLPNRLAYEDEDGMRVETPYRVIRLWEVDPAPAFEAEGQPLLPWVPLLKGGAPEFERAVHKIEQIMDSAHPLVEPRVLMVQLATMAALRYDKKAVKEFLQRLEQKLMISSDALKVSWLYQDGIAEGLLEGKRSSLRVTLSAKFPYEEFPEVDQVHDPEALDNLIRLAVQTDHPDHVRAAILASVRPQ